MPYAGYLGDCYPTAVPGDRHAVQPAEVQPVPDLTSVADNPAEARKMVPARRPGRRRRDGQLPDFSFVDANECANMHGGPPWCEDSPNNLGEPNDNKLVAGGDSYLRQVTSEIMSGPQWRHGNNAIVVTWTEGITSAGCCDAKPGTGRVFTIVVTSHGPRHLTDATHVQPLLAAGHHPARVRAAAACSSRCDTKHVLPMAKLFGAKSDGAESFPRAAAAPALASAPRSTRPRPAKGAAPVRCVPRPVDSRAEP